VLELENFLSSVLEPLPEVGVTLQVCTALAQVAKHSVDLAEAVVEAEVFPKVLTCLQFPDDTVRKAAATLVREVAKHSVDLAQLIVGSGGVGALVDYIQVLSSSTLLVLVLSRCLQGLLHSYACSICMRQCTFCHNLACSISICETVSSFITARCC